MPSCAPASITDRFWPARITVHRAAFALFGEGLEAVAARRDQRELRSDEERVRGEQQRR